MFRKCCHSSLITNTTAQTGTRVKFVLGNIYQAAGVKVWTAEDCKPPPSKNKNYEVPAYERLLKVMPKAPLQPVMNRQKMMFLIRGPCLGEGAELKLQKFGVVILKGARLKHGHFQYITDKVNRFIRDKPLHAIWRVPPPYRPVTRHPLQAVMGGGKGKIDHYITPVKARQVIFEVAGSLESNEVLPTLRKVATGLPAPAIAVDHEMLQALYEEERRIEDENENFFTFREIVEKNMQGMRKYVTYYDLQQFGKMR